MSSFASINPFLTRQWSSTKSAHPTTWLLCSFLCFSDDDSGVRISRNVNHHCITGDKSRCWCLLGSKNFWASAEWNTQQKQHQTNDHSGRTSERYQVAPQASQLISPVRCGNGSSASSRTGAKQYSVPSDNNKRYSCHWPAQRRNLIRLCPQHPTLGHQHLPDRLQSSVE